ncbi:myeloid-associated differentiation marker-like [Cervus elaphus]|uniref:myeloid-associated differentiation marker-like n=1 Tax=Cervus elaphus TaxID=9860 RepID=UPI001CC32D83|nr:myeloid-associated differentiation marker-like [Cervus elaphus]
MVCFVPSFPGVLRRLENYVACVIFAFISNTDLYQHQSALVWCVAVYSICFVLGAVNYFVNGCDCDNDKKLPLRIPCLLWVQTVLSVLLYATTVILWPLYQFHEKLGGQPQRSSDMSCSDQLTTLVCIWDQRLVVAILTAINLLIYVADMVYLACEAISQLFSQAFSFGIRPTRDCGTMVYSGSASVFTLGFCFIFPCLWRDGVAILRNQEVWTMSPPGK